MRDLAFVFIFLFGLVFLIQFSSAAQITPVTPNFQNIEIENNEFVVHEVIDARIEKGMVGIVYDYKSASNEKSIFDSDDPLNIALISLFEIQNYTNPNSIPVYITVNKLMVSNFYGENNLYRAVEINLDFYVASENRHFHEFTAGEYVISTIKPTTEKVHKMIEDAILSCYYEFLFRMNNKIGYHKEVTFEDLNHNSLKTQLIHSFYDLEGENRIFYTFNMFRDNVADYETAFYLKGLKNYHNDLAFFKYYPGKPKAATSSNIWGVVYENNLYVQVDGVFIRAYPTKDGYMIMNMISFKNRSKAKEGFSIAGGFGLLLGSIIGGGFGGAALGLITGGIGAATGAFSKDIKICDSPFKIDMFSGLPVKYEQIQAKPEIVENRIIVFYSRKLNSQTLELFINENIACQFTPNSYYIHRCSDTKDSLNICLKIPGNSWCESITADFVGKRYFEVIVKSNGKMTLFEKKQSQTKKYVEDRIKRRKLRSLN